MSRERFRPAGFAALLLLAASLPFELERPVLPLGPIVLTNVEVVLLAVLGLALLAGPAPHRPRLPRAWIILALWFVAAMLLAAAAAPAFRGNALKAALRTVEGMLLVPAVLWLAPTARYGRLVALGLVGSVAAAVAVGLAEQAAGYDFAWLAAFRSAPTFAGPFLRLSGPLDYANQAAMMIEATIPLLFALTLEFAARRHTLATLGLVALLFFIQAAILTFSRAGFVTLLVVSAFVAALRVRHPGTARRAARPWAGLALLIAAVVVANWLLSPTFRLRLRSDVDGEWYRTVLQAPAELTLAPAERLVVPLVVTNSGALPWRTTGSKPVVLGARWQLADGRGELQDRLRWPLPRAVAPGETVTLDVALFAPTQPGDYRLIWDMVQEGVNWFDARGDAETSTLVKVAGTGVENPAAQAARIAPSLAFDAPLPGRRVLWAIAARLIERYPLTGIGLDNYRLTYSGYLPDDPLPGTALDQTVHTNNWYLETLVSVGIVGTAPFLLWLLLLIWDIIHLLRRPSTAPLLVAAGASLLTFTLHGLLDYFLLFNATALLFWTITALWLVFKYDNSRL